MEYIARANWLVDRDRFSSRSLFLLALLSLTGCASYSANQSPRSPAPVVEATIIDGRTLPLPEQQRAQRESLTNIPKVSPAVSNLIAKANAHMNQQEFEKAASSIERGLRLEPRNASLWNRLAEIRYLQKDWSQAVQLAARSNSMPNLQPDVKRRNWWIMSQSYDSLGDQLKAQQYADLLVQ
jgi:cytochrome c-type biogenesis protein CcmH/NrfG